MTILSYNINQKITASTWLNWKWQLRNRLKGLNILESLGIISESLDKKFRFLLKKYHFATTPYYFSLCKELNYSDPIFRQIIPSLEEIDFKLSGSEPDPLAEEKHSITPHLIHRYPDRVLVVTTNFCASYCRHCNRKRFWSERPWVIDKKELEQILFYIKKNKHIREVILSGGDPLFINQSYLEYILSRIREIKTVEVIRIGTRIPVVLPMKITVDLCQMLKKYRPIWLNTHFNHPQEITKEAEKAADLLSLHGIAMANQTVLLKEINDDLDTLAQLFTALERILIKPYYLFHCDSVSGTDHFRTSIEKGMELISGLEGKIGGLCIPKFVVDLPQGRGKAPCGPNFLEEIDGNIAIFKTWEGEKFIYKDAQGAK